MQVIEERDFSIKGNKTSKCDNPQKAWTPKQHFAAKTFLQRSYIN